MSVRERRMAVWALAVLSTLAPAAADGNIGCLFSPSLCAKGVEWCYDDVAFGKCIPIYEDQPEDSAIYQYSMSSEELKSFEAALQKLLALGYRWEHAYTQCVLQAMLYSSREQLKTVNMKICEQFSDPDIISETKEEGEEVDPEEVAYVRFTPNDSPISDSDFANEVYAPPLPSDDLLGPSDYPISKEAPYIDGDGTVHRLEDGSTRQEYTGKFHDLMSLRGEDPVEGYPFEEFRGEFSPGSSDVNLEGDFFQGSDKTKKSYPSDNGFDEEEEAYETAAERTLSNLRKLDVGDASPHTSEYITSNRFTPKEAQVLSSTMQRYRERFRAKQFPFEYEEESNDIPESRVYVDEVDAVEAPLDSGSGHFDPYKILLQDDDLSESEKSKNMDYLMALWKSDILRGNKPLDALYAEGGPLIMDQPTGNTKYLSNEDFHDILSNYDWGFKRRERLDVKKPGPRLDLQALMFKYKKNVTEASQPHTTPVKKESHGHYEYKVDPSFTYVLFEDRNHDKTDWDRGVKIITKIRELLGFKEKELTNFRVDKGEVTFKVENNSKNMSAEDVAANIDAMTEKLAKDPGILVYKTGVGDKIKGPGKIRVEEPSFLGNRDNILAMLLSCGLVVAVAGTLLGVMLWRDAKARRKLAGLASATDIDAEATQDYQELCRARMTGGKWSGQQTCAASGAVCGGDAPQRIASLSREPDNNSPSARSSTSSWSEEPALTNMDISTGHMVLAYMEDHLKNKDRLEQEWAALCAYEAEPSGTTAAHADDNLNKNRCRDVVPYDHSRVTLNTLTNHLASDYINASTITDHDPRNPAYIAAQGPLPHTAPDFWQMVWEQGSVVMVMLTRLTENGVQMCHRYWPEEASDLYHIYEVHLVSEHIWCDDYLVRSFYLKNQRTGETRTVTQFHFLSWPDSGVPASTKALLEFRRKVNKSYRGRSCPIVVHCSDGASRTGTYCLIDMVLNRMAKGAKEIDIAATLEHIRDQRPRMVSTKQQFEFVLMAVAEEVHAILKALPAQLQQQHDKKEKDNPVVDKDKAN